jgi:hypothetical protein
MTRRQFVRDLAALGVAAGIRKMLELLRRG